MKILILAVLALFVGCANYTPDQITAVTNSITSIETTTGQVVTPFVVHYDNGRSVQVTKVSQTQTVAKKPKK